MTPNGSKTGASPPAEARLDLGQWVRERRTANRMTQSELALLAGVGRRLVSGLERGKASLQLAGVDAVLAVFGKRLGIQDVTREPIDGEPHASNGLHPFFAGLLPEGWLFDISISTLKLARDDGFGLLLALCRDCLGAVRIEPEPSGG